MKIFTLRLNQLYDEVADVHYPYSRRKYAVFLGESFTQNKVADWLDGRSEPSITDLCEIAKKHNVSVEWLVGNTDIRDPFKFSLNDEIGDKIDNLSEEQREGISKLLDFLK